MRKFLLGVLFFAASATAGLGADDQSKKMAMLRKLSISENLPTGIRLASDTPS